MPAARPEGTLGREREIARRIVDPESRIAAIGPRGYTPPMGGRPIR